MADNNKSILWRISDLKIEITKLVIKEDSLNEALEICYKLERNQFVTSDLSVIDYTKISSVSKKLIENKPNTVKTKSLSEALETYRELDYNPYLRSVLGINANTLSVSKKLIEMELGIIRETLKSKKECLRNLESEWDAIKPSVSEIIQFWSI